MKRVWDNILSVVVPFVVTLAVFFLIFRYVGHPVTISGRSMAPTLNDGERVWLNCHDKDYQRGEIIVFSAPDGSGDEYVKRVIGVPGDTVEYRDNVLYVNGQIIEEPYLDVLKALNPGKDVTPNWSLETLPTTQSSTVPEGELFVLGDNRPVSKDSEEFGFIDQTTVDGTTRYRIWPLNKIGKIQPVSAEGVEPAQ